VSFLGGLFGKRQADSDPHPGIGGYLTPRGDLGETGYPGSTSTTRLNPEQDTRPRTPEFPQQIYGRPAHRRRMLTIPEQQASVIPPPAHQGGIPWHGPDSKVNPQGPGQSGVRDTEVRRHTIIGGAPEGGQDVRNTKYYGGVKARPGETRTYRSAPQGRHFEITEVSVPNRHYKDFDGLSDSLQARKMPYTGHDEFRGNLGHARGSRRGAVLDGARFYQQPDTELNQGGGFGAVRTAQRHRPTVFQEPAPWSARNMVTTAETGTPDSPGADSHVVDNIEVSPSTGRRSARRHRG